MWDYGKNIFDKADFKQLAKTLSAIKGQFIMSINDVPDIRFIFGKFRIEGVQTSYSLATKAGTATGRKELIISKLAVQTVDKE